ncbi:MULTISPECIES: hypothetical protein [unclassified Microbacterium]|uniref:hypothetical protein n=1 Tax=unclassified Microbacterium TaxID=2609290 RepID=UPI00109BF776|nr:MULTISPECIES: hypothetical protein [unclassified Microbacterium]
MTADILSDPTYPHSTAEGFTGGCRGSHCPGPVPCRDVHTRYQGDFGFRRAIDAGETAAQIVERERKHAAETAAAAKAAQMTVKAQRPGKAARGRQYVRKDPGVPITDNQRQVLHLHSAGLTDGEIAERLGKTRAQVNATRHHLRLQPNRASSTTDRIAAFHAKGLSDILIAKEIGRNLDYVRSRRRSLRLPINPHRPPVLKLDDLTRLHSEGLTDRQIGERLNVDPKYVGRRRRKLELAPNPAPASSGASSFQENT